MKTVIKEITPEWAKKILETRNPKNRTMHRATVEKLVRDMKNGAFHLTHQGICFYESGDLADGQHRLQAGVESGITFKSFVTTGMPLQVPVNGSVVNTFELIDCGKARGVDKMLAMAGYHHAAATAGICRGLLSICRNVKPFRISTAQAHKVLMYLDKSVTAIAPITQTKGFVRLKVPHLGPLALYHNSYPQKAIEFAVETIDASGSKNSPTRLFGLWIKNHPSIGSDATKASVEATMFALHAFHHGEEPARIISGPQFGQWLRDLDKSKTETIAEIASL